MIYNYTNIMNMRIHDRAGQLSCFPNSTISAKVPSTNYSIQEFVLDVSKDIIKENGCFPPICFY